jgi:hypothetical protein
VETCVPQKTRITAIELASGDRIDKLTVKYENAQGRWTTEHGGGGGHPGSSLFLQDGEFINNITGRADVEVDQLNFFTTENHRTHDGQDGGHPFTDTTPQGSFLLGFAGRSGKRLDQIQFIYGVLRPATWS